MRTCGKTKCRMDNDLIRNAYSLLPDRSLQIHTPACNICVYIIIATCIIRCWWYPDNMLKGWRRYKRSGTVQERPKAQLIWFTNWFLVEYGNTKPLAKSVVFLHRYPNSQESCTATCLPHVYIDESLSTRWFCKKLPSISLTNICCK